MKCVRIDPFRRVVETIDTDQIDALAGLDKLTVLQSLVTRGSGGLVEKLCELTRARKVGNGLDLIGDEEALLKEDRAFFLWSWNQRQRAIYCGVCLIVGVELTEEGESWESVSFVDRSHQLGFQSAIRRSVRFMSKEQVMTMARSHAEAGA